ncbi:MAG: cytoplasmic glycerophosphodiester phosphodiesterase, partial [Rhizobacter sp.]|nr:cytoplasmic glycerophosphodiester phosphodiesterase [Rhizobacter sp.]
MNQPTSKSEFVAAAGGVNVAKDGASPTDSGSTASWFDHWPYPLWIAHRGAGKRAPENTLAAFRLGASHGYRAFECDVKLSADGVPFLLHDDTLERTTNGSGIAGHQRWSALSRLDAGSWHGRTFSGEPPPSLEAIASFALHNGFAINLEIKPTTGLALETGREVARMAKRLWSKSNSESVASKLGRAPESFARPPLLPLLTSFQPHALQGAREAAPDLPRGLLLSEWHEGWLDQALALGCVAVVAAVDILDAGTIGTLHKHRLRALSYT